MAMAVTVVTMTVRGDGLYGGDGDGDDDNGDDLGDGDVGNGCWARRKSSFISISSRGIIIHLPRRW